MNAYQAQKTMSLMNGRAAEMPEKELNYRGTFICPGMDRAFKNAIRKTWGLQQRLTTRNSQDYLIVTVNMP
ncbi:hypothetical protein [Desertivirga arenae]|uniref:hypothetical protein n=1 Tax=Desertivirga arenae TaxID=2810309 RepID=UPI001A968495|nr:hypothetical protein [Pedobacter sp. SYSU D00823]